MKFSINYSLEAAELLAAGRIQLDYFKCPNWPDLVSEACRYAPVAVHFDLTAGSGKLAEQTDWDSIDKLLTHTHTPYVNVHIDPPLKVYPGLDVARQSPQEVEQIRAAVAADLRDLVQRFGADKVIAENPPYHAAQGHVLRCAGDPIFIHEVIEDAGCGLLFDLSHAAISAQYLGIAESDYFKLLPLNRLRELHFTGIHNVNGRLTDHLPALPADWQRLDRALDSVASGMWGKAWMLAFEYGGIGDLFSWRSDREAIAEQVPILFARVGAVL